MSLPTKSKDLKSLLERTRILLSRANPRLMLVSVIAGFLLTAVLMNFRMNIFEAYLYDFRMRHQGRVSTDSPIVLVSIDDRTIEALSTESAVPIEQHLKLLEFLKKSKAQSVAYFVSFNESIEHSHGDKKATQKFTSLAQGMIARGTKVFLGTDFNFNGEVLPPAPLDQLPHHITVIHKDASVFSEDKVTRRALLTISGEKTIHALAAETFLPRASGFQYQGVFHVKEANADKFMINYAGDTREGYHPFKQVSFVDAVSGKISPDFFKGKIVLIGAISHDNSNDYVYTPFSREVFRNPRLVVHAHIIQTLLDNSAIINSSFSVDVCITFFLTIFVVWMVFNTTPARGVGITMMLAISFVFTSLILFRLFDFSLNMSHPLLGIFFAYYVFVPYRLMTEFRKRSEFQRQHEVLMQVDELKRNFMSLITHDLKTPVARIQGMAEILGRAGADSKIVKEIVHSTEELNRFITSILELAKVETNRVKLERTSKDVNKVIEDCVRNFQFEAESKNIEIATDLEPLFPILVDVALLSKVIANLLDNALKYSPPGSQVVIHSKESIAKPGFIEISITDNGNGIKPKDLENLFLKFYRPQSDQSMTVKGYGLGLYLSRYFMELHQGTISVTSEPGKGSTFTILLPEQAQQNADGGLYA